MRSDTNVEEGSATGQAVVTSAQVEGSATSAPSSGDLLKQKATPLRTAIILVIIGVPLFFWFRYLYIQYVVLPDQMTPAQQQMRDSMMKAHAGGTTQARPSPKPRVEGGPREKGASEKTH